jgi:hypothetical protein
MSLSPKKKPMYPSVLAGCLHSIVTYDRVSITNFLKERLQKIPQETERKLCLKIAKLCNRPRLIRVVHSHVHHESGIFAAEIEVADEREDWEKHRWQPYFEGENLLKADLGDGVKIRLCLGGSAEGHGAYRSSALSIWDCDEE